MMLDVLQLLDDVLAAADEKKTKSSLSLEVEVMLARL